MNRATYEEQIRLYVETSGDKQIAALYEQLAKLASGADTSASQAAELVAELERLAAVSNGIRSFPALKQQVEATAKQLGEAKARAAELRAEFNAAEAPTKRLAASVQRADAAVEKLTVTEARQRVELERTSRVLKAAGVDTERLGEAAQAVQWQFGQFGEKADEAARAAGRLGREGDSAARGIGSIDQAAKGAAGSLAGVGARLTGVATAAAAAIAAMAAAGSAALFTGAIRSAATLDDALTQVRAVTGSTAKEMDALKAAAERAGSTTRFSTLEAAQGLGELARATGSAQSAIAALPATLSLAQVAGLGVAEAATIMTTAMTSFGLAGDQASRVADVLAKEANSTTDNVQSMALALSYASPFASALSLDIEDVAAAIGVLADNGFRGERAGTALRFTFAQMTDTSSEFSKAVRALGIETTDFGDMLRELATKGDLGREAIAKLGTEAAPAIQRLAQSTPKLAALEATLRNAGGEAARTAAIMGQSLTSATESITDSFDRTRRALVDPLLEPLQKELLALSRDLEQFASSPDFEILRESLVTLFKEGASAARELITNVDFKALAQDIREFATDSDGSLTSFRDSLTVIADAVRVVGQTTSLVFNAVQTAILAIATVVSKAISQLAKAVNTLEAPVAKVLELLGLAPKQASALEEFASGMSAVADDFAARTIKNFDETLEAAQQLGDGVGEAAGRVSAASEAAATAGKGQAAANREVADSAVGATQAVDAQAAATGQLAAQTSAARAQLEIDAGRLKKAFSDLGIQSQSELQRSAEAAKRNFELIRAAAATGAASAEDAKRAFIAYADAARAASADSTPAIQAGVESELRLHAAVLEVNDALSRQGAAGLRAGAGVQAGAEAATGSYALIEAQAEGAASATGDVGAATAKAGAAAKQGAGEMQSFAIAGGSVSLEFTRAALSLNRFVNSVNNASFFSGMKRLTGEYDREAEQLREQMETLDKQLAAHDPLTKRVEELRAQYKYLGEDQLRALAEKERQVADLQRQQLEQADAAREAMREAAAAPVGGASITPRAAAQVAGAATDVLDRAESAAAAIASATSRLASTPRVSGELVIRIISEAPAGAQPFRLDAAQARELTAAVLRELNWQKGLGS